MGGTKPEFRRDSEMKFHFFILALSWANPIDQRRVSQSADRFQKNFEVSTCDLVVCEDTKTTVEEGITKIISRRYEVCKNGRSCEQILAEEKISKNIETGPSNSNFFDDDPEWSIFNKSSFQQRLASFNKEFDSFFQNQGIFNEKTRDRIQAERDEISDATTTGLDSTWRPDLTTLRATSTTTTSTTSTSATTTSITTTKTTTSTTTTTTTTTTTDLLEYDSLSKD